MQPTELIHDIPTDDASVSGLWPSSSPSLSPSPSPSSYSYSSRITPNPKASVPIAAASSCAHYIAACAVSPCETPFATPRTSPQNNNSASSSPPYLINLRKWHSHGAVSEDYSESHYAGSTIMSREEDDMKIEEIICYYKKSMGVVF
ncbi:hypothetical protein Ancab_010458 [Ancistrocladus abbreviatus]